MFLDIGCARLPEELRKRVVEQYPRVNFKEGIAKAFVGGFEHKTQTAGGTCNEDICSKFIRNYSAAISTIRFRIRRSRIRRPDSAGAEDSAVDVSGDAA
jgi:hypothetical protein